MLSYRCSAACRHCMYGCSSKWSGDWIPEKDLKKLLFQLKGRIKPSPWGEEKISLNYGIHFTGGEPFLNFELLTKATNMASELDIPSIFAETNCFWCSSDKITRERLEILKREGLRGILVSVNPFFAEYVPFERTERCIRIGREVFGDNLVVYQTEFYHQFKELGIKNRIPVEKYLTLTGKKSLTGRVELFLMGRAAYKLRDFYPVQPAQNLFNQPCRPSFLRNWHNHFDNYGNFLPGYCGGISLGSWHNLDRLTREGIDVEKRPILGFLINEDIKGLFHFAKDFGYQEQEDGYLSKCDLCLRLRDYLNSQKDFEELQPKDFYRFVKQ